MLQNHYQKGVTSVMSSAQCAICRHEFGNSSRKFYCCQPNVRYCILCKYKEKCLKCRSVINFKQVKSPKCEECYFTSSEEKDFYLHEKCNKHICSKCLLTRLRRSNPDSSSVTLFCAHEENKNKVIDFLNNFCRSCGTVCDSVLDYQLLNGEKCCFSCFKYNQNQITDLVLRCMSCDQVIRKFHQAGTCQNDFILCKNCVAFSNIQQTNISRHNEEIKKREGSTQKKKQEKNTQKKVEQAISKQKLNVKQIDSEIIVEEKEEEQSKKQSLAAIKEQNQKMEKQVKKADGKTGVKKMEQSGKDMTDSKQSKATRSLKKTILNKFPSQDNVIILDSFKETKMKKHLSMETYVEALAIQIQKQTEKTLECAQCGYLVEENEMYEIEKSKQNKQNNIKKKYCRLCYALLCKNQLLSFNTQNIKYQSNLTDSRNKRGISSQKHTRKPMEIHYQTEIKPSNLEANTGHLEPRADNNKLIGKLSGTFEDKRNNLAPRQENRYCGPKDPHIQKCNKCQNSNGTLIRTVKDGNLCFSCYYKAREVR